MRRSERSVSIDGDGVHVSTPARRWQRPVAAVALVTAVVPVAVAVAVTGCHHHRRHPCTPSALQRVSSHVVASGALAAVGVSSGGHPNTQT